MEFRFHIFSYTLHRSTKKEYVVIEGPEGYLRRTGVLFSLDLRGLITYPLLTGPHDGLSLVLNVFTLYLEPVWLCDSNTLINNGVGSK